MYGPGYTRKKKNKNCLIYWCYPRKKKTSKKRYLFLLLVASRKRKKEILKKKKHLENPEILRRKGKEKMCLEYLQVILNFFPANKYNLNSVTQADGWSTQTLCLLLDT